MTEPIDQGAAAAGEQAAAISRQVVAVVAQYTGRGPTKVRTHMTDELVSVVMRDTLLKAERHLVADGKAEMVIALRREFQETMRADLVAAVESVTRRTVICFLSDHRTDPDIAVESFILE